MLTAETSIEASIDKAISELETVADPIRAKLARVGACLDEVRFHLVVPGGVRVLAWEVEPRGSLSTTP